MALFSTPARKHTAYYDNLMGPRTVSERQAEGTATETPAAGNTTTCEEDRSRSADQSREVNNRTYVISSKGSSASSSAARGRLALQRRKTGAENNAEKTVMSENTRNTTPAAPEKRPTLQRRTRTASIDKSAISEMISTATTSGTSSSTDTKVLTESNRHRTPAGTGVFRSASVRDTTAFRSKAKEDTDTRTTAAKTDYRPDRFVHKTPSGSSSYPSRPLVGLAKKPDEPTTKTFPTPNRKTPFERLAIKKDVFEKLTGGRDVVLPRVLAARSASSERPKMHTPRRAEDRNPAATSRLNKVPASPPPTQLRKITTLMNSDKSGNLARNTAAPVPTPAEIPVSVEPLVQQEPLKMENSAVTVAVRLRPFSAREKTEQALQVIFMQNQETLVQHPDTKQELSFTYDFSFCSVDESDPSFASQQMVYERLARPLLEKAFDGFNTCLFAYGQTGSGKSYTMMGFGEQEGVIPRFCQDLFSRLTSTVNLEVTCHLEMSYFEVYNEKIHDLLVVREEQTKRMPLRVREHPVHGPYVAELSANVVSCYSDIQGWLKLGNKQRATAATGMNDKSSRSHSVFTLVMTQTKTEFVEGEEHDHRITSRINLVDLAGSERCNSAQTSGDRLREGASINKSLLTLGRVISALSEQAQTRKVVFTPYRESVLTWLLKESLGGNSKTAMIATLSPAASYVEESLSTLRYARQARLIINQAKVNEDTNAKLIRELKAEVEKLRSAQMSSLGVEPEKMRLFQQEITALKSKLSQQDREMAEAHRAWREKLEEAEIRKREEIEKKELQSTFKLENSLPNLVNLNEDPQLSEMLLYMIQEGPTRVGKHNSESAHDIQLTGALIADEHCVISNVRGTVSITPMEDAKTFVNGNLISESTILQHGDRVILGGDHYFRFNHPAEVQSGKRVSCWTGSGDGQKDFEFAKNELLSAQRVQLEAEIEEARMKAKEEMVQGIQMAKEVAQKELSDQKALYEDRIQALERELEEESERKSLQEQAQQRVASQVEQLQTARLELQHEVDTHKKRHCLHMEAQAMEENTVRQAKIVEALEAEKMKLSKDLEEMQTRQALRKNRSPKTGPPQWNAMKLSLMIEEANKIGAKLRKNTVFSRHEAPDKENSGGEGGLQVQVHNTKLGISTFWTLEKFSNNMATMRELDQGDPASKDDDVFYDPNDEWEQDLSASSCSSTFSFSRRRSRSLLKSRRISGRLYEIRVHPIQSLLNSSSSSAGLMGVAKPPSVYLSSADSALPGICKEMTSQAVARLLRDFGSTEESLADRLASDLCLVYTAIQTISDLYDGLDDDSQEKVFVSNTEAQTQLVKATSHINAAVSVTELWLASSKPTSGQLYTTAEELKTQVKRMGGFFQLLIQGCDSEITSMVTEAQRKSGQSLDKALKALGHLAAMTGVPLHTAELDARATGKLSITTALLEGTNHGVRSLLEEGLRITKEMLREAQLAYPRTPALQSVRSRVLDLACALQSYILCNMTEREASPEKVGEEEAEEEVHTSQLCRSQNTAAKLLQLNQAVRQLHDSISCALRGKGRRSDLHTYTETICSSAKTINELISGLPKGMGASLTSSGLQLPRLQSVMAVRDTVYSALQSLSATFSPQEAAESTGSTASDESAEDGSWSKRNRLVPKRVITLSNSETHWV